VYRNQVLIERIEILSLGKLRTGFLRLRMTKIPKRKGGVSKKGKKVKVNSFKRKEGFV